MRFTSLIAVSSLVITLGAFQAAAVQEDVSLATFENNSPMINLARRAEPEAEGGETGGETGGKTGEAAQVPEEAEAKTEAEAADAQKDQVLPADGGKENNRNEGNGGDSEKERGVQEATSENVKTAGVAKSQKAGKSKKHAKASKMGASKASKGPKASKASKEQGLAEEAEMESPMLASSGGPRRARKAGHNGKSKMARPAGRGGRVPGHNRIGRSGNTHPRKTGKKAVSKSSMNGASGTGHKSGGGGGGPTALLKGLTGGLGGGLLG